MVRVLPPRVSLVSPVLVLIPILGLMVGGCRAGGPSALDGDTGVSDAGDGGDLVGGAAGFALGFDGVNDYATAGDGSFPAAGAEQTLEMWVNYPSAATTQDFLVLREDFDHGVQVGLRNGTVAVWTTYAHTILAAAPTLPAVNQWHHVAYAWDTTTHRLYVDGVMAAMSTAISDKRTPTSAWLGTVDGTAELYKGTLDEVRVWAVVRSATDIAADMHHRPAGAEAGLVAYFPFDDPAAGGRSADVSGLGNDVTLGDGIADRMPAWVPSDAPAAP